MAPASPMKIRAGMEVVGEEAEAQPEADHRHQGSGVVGADVAGAEQLVGVQEEGARRDGHDARGQPVEAVDEVDRVGHARPPRSPS